MGRETKGITEQQIRDAIEQMIADDLEPSTTGIRAIIGTGSYSTISSVLTKWRDQQQANSRGRAPKIPATVNQLFQRVWSEVWQAANARHELELAGINAEKKAWSDEKRELLAEITRLETIVEQQTIALADHDKQQISQAELLAQRDNELAAARAAAATFETENERLREERQQFASQLSAVTERAVVAETMLSRSRQAGQN